MSKSIKIMSLPRRLTVEHVGELHHALIAASSGRSSLMLQLSEVEEVDAAGLQLLTAFLQWSRHNGVQIVFSGSVPAALEIALLTSGYCREVPSEGQRLHTFLLSTVGGEYAG